MTLRDPLQHALHDETRHARVRQTGALQHERQLSIWLSFQQTQQRWQPIGLAAHTDATAPHDEDQQPLTDCHMSRFDRPECFSITSRTSTVLRQTPSMQALDCTRGGSASSST